MTGAVPGDAWKQAGFDDASWQEGAGGFGEVPERRGHTEGKTGDISLRRHFNPGELTPEQTERLVVRDFHDEDVQISINGVGAYSSKGYIPAHENRNLAEAARKALKPGADNVLAAHCHQTEGGQHIDVGLSVRVDPKVP